MTQSTVLPAPAVPTEDAPTWPIGSSPLRKEDDVLLRGAGRFVDDLPSPDALHAAILRSPLPHGRVRAIDTSAARGHDGVVDVISSADLPGGGPPIPIRMFPRPGMERFLQRPLARGRVRYVGEPVAVVVADSRYVAEDALELIEVDWEPLPVALDATAAMADEAPLLHPEAGSNLVSAYEIADGDAAAAFAAADLVVEELIGCGRHAAVPMETRGLLAATSDDGAQLTVWGPTKVAHTNRKLLAGMLDWPLERIRFVEPHVGGGFGARGELYPEDYLIPFCAIRLGRPVRWTEDREEHLRATNHSREQTERIAIALAADGTFLGLRAEIVMNTGAYVRTHGGVVPGMSAGLLPGPYRFPALALDVRQVVTNKTPAGTYRAPGRYEATLARERVIDVAARKLGRDPCELRRQNLVLPEQMPYANGSSTDGHPVVYDSGDYPRLLDEGLEHFGYERMRAWRDAEVAPHLRRGLGVALFVEKSGIGVWEYARVEVEDNGAVVVYTGAASLGQGLETVLAQICAETLDVPYEAIGVRHGDTDEVPKGMGSFGSRGTSLGGAAVAEASVALRARLLETAAEQLECAPGELELAQGRFKVRGSPRATLSLAALAAAATDALSDEATFTSEQMSFPYGLHCAAVELDVELGSVRIERYSIAYDVGRAINPKLVEGQLLGGFAQGLGGALYEHLAYDEDGQLVAGSLMDYLLPTATEVPELALLITEHAPTPRVPLGAKGAGEGGTTAAGAAIANAVSDAVGVEVTSLPILPEWIVAAGSGAAA
ncbi:MAG: xanthine dehydrogenase family protein molybdopterin-binding subunit [Conexibacter sp.]